jgi:cytochrome-b5 reductase
MVWRQGYANGLYSIIKAICTNDKDNTKVTLLYGNKTENDILLRKELDEYAKKCPHKFRLWYVLNSPPEGWKYGTGYITKTMAKELLPAPNGDESKILLCGPPGLQSAMTNSLVDLGFRRPGPIARTTDEIFMF